MGGLARIERARLERFNRYWESLYKAVPDARSAAVRAMGEAVKKELDAQILAADLEADAKGTVQSWQELQLGSKGGYAAISAKKGALPAEGKKQKTWHGKPVTFKQVTRFLEKGHGVRKPAPGSVRQFSRAGRSGINRASGTRYVKARQFYSFTKGKAMDLAIKAADQALAKIVDEVDY